MPKVPSRPTASQPFIPSPQKMALGKPRPQPPAPLHPTLRPLTWTDKQITVVRGRTAGTVSILARVSLPLAVHRTLVEGMERGDPAWSVSHVQTGTLITAVTREVDAYRIAEALLREVGAALKEETVARVRSRLPEWVEPWVTECRARKVYVDPAPYVGGGDAEDP